MPGDRSSHHAGPNLSSKLISAVYDAGVRILNMAEFKDLIYTDQKFFRFGVKTISKADFLITRREI